ncbi:MAG: hypothetical protein GX458_08905, partial [Phyllobacteriaceae bacterium]|nr:hypothetical protein [Phyllobacteriaceae bacterium]
MLVVALCGGAQAQSSTLRGGLDGEVAQPTVSSDLLGLGETVSPLDATARGVAATDPNAPTDAATLQPIRPATRAPRP